MDELLLKNNPGNLTIEEQEKLRQILRGLITKPEQFKRSITWNDITNKPTWINNLPTLLATPSGVQGSGLAGRIAEWLSSNTLQSSTLRKTGVGILTLVANVDYTLTIPDDLHWHIENENLSSLCDNVTTNYPTGNPFVLGTTKLYLNQVRQTINLDYIEIAGTSIKWAAAPLFGDTVMIDYQLA